MLKRLPMSRSATATIRPFTALAWTATSSRRHCARSRALRPASCIAQPRKLAAASGDAITLPDLNRAIVDCRQHAGRVAGDDDVEDGRARAFGEAFAQGRAEALRFLDSDSRAAHRAGDRRVIHLDKVGGLIAAAEHRMLQRLDIARCG